MGESCSRSEEGTSKPLKEIKRKPTLLRILLNEEDSKTPINIKDAQRSDNPTLLYWFMSQHPGEPPRLKTGATDDCDKKAIFEAQLSDEDDKIKLQLQGSNQYLAVNCDPDAGNNPFFQMTEPTSNPLIVQEYHIGRNEDISKFMYLRIQHPTEKSWYYWQVNETTKDVELDTSDKNAAVFVTEPPPSPCK